MARMIAASPPTTPHGHEAYEAISALQKAVRRVDVEGAAYRAWEVDCWRASAAR